MQYASSYMVVCGLHMDDGLLDRRVFPSFHILRNQPNWPLTFAESEVADKANLKMDAKL